MLCNGSMDSVDIIINAEEGSFTFYWGKKVLINCFHAGNNFKLVPASPAEWNYPYWTYRSSKNKLEGKGKLMKSKQSDWISIFLWGS